MKQPLPDSAGLYCKNGHPNRSDARFCEECGMELMPVPDPGVSSGSTQKPSRAHRDIILARNIGSTDVGRLRGLLQGKLQIRTENWFPKKIRWPSKLTRYALIQTLPEEAEILSKTLDSESAKGIAPWKLELIREIAAAIDELDQVQLRLNSLNFDSIIVSTNGRCFLGFCVPMCISHADPLRTDITVTGLDSRFASPETQGFTDHSIKLASDLFLLAMITYYLLSGRKPWVLSESGFEVVSLQDRLGPSLSLFLEEATSLNPAARPQSGKEFCERLRKAIVKDSSVNSFDIAVGAVSDIGVGGRDNNEDSCATWSLSGTGAGGEFSLGGFAVADGMGGSAFGERASSLCTENFVKQVADFLPDIYSGLYSSQSFVETCRSWLMQLNEDVVSLSHCLGAGNNVGSTLTALLILGSRSVLIHAGDSRAYLVKGDNITQLTKDQTYARQLVEEGQLEPHEEETSIHKSTLTSFIGTKDCSPQVELFDLEGGEIFVLCSDGILEGVTDADIKHVAYTRSPSVAAQTLVVRSKERIREKYQATPLDTGPPISDNMTVVIVKALSPLRRLTGIDFEESPKGTAENDESQDGIEDSCSSSGPSPR